MASNKAVGIDLGTTYSAVAWVNESGRSTLLPNAEGDLTTPSVVLFEDSEIIVGREAKKVAVVQPDRVAQCAKRDMGKAAYHRPIRGQRLPPEVIQSYVLKKLHQDAVAQIGEGTRCVITVPAYFDETRRKATWQAGEMAGLRMLDIVNEPTAAALAYGEELGYLTKFGAPKERIKVLVYDLGGGTFDVTLIDMQAGNLRTVATDGDVQLGGYDWDMRLVNHLASEFEKQHAVDPRQSPAGLQRLLLLAEEAKHTLSARTHTTVRVEHEGRAADVSISRQQFEELTADLLERTRFTTKSLLATAHIDWKSIRRILLTGGSTRMPMVQRMLKELSGIEPDMAVNPDEAVARGASLYANYLLASKGETGHEPTFDITNVNSHALGVEGIDPDTKRRRNKVLIKRNTPLPTKVVKPFMTKEAGQKSVVVKVMEGDSKDPDACIAVGRTVIRDLPPSLPAGWPVEVTFEYGVNGRLNVRAKVKGTDRETTLELERNESLSDNKAERWKQVVKGGKGLDAFELMIEEALAEDARAQAKTAHRPIPLAPGTKAVPPAPPAGAKPPPVPAPTSAANPPAAPSAKANPPAPPATAVAKPGSAPLSGAKPLSETTAKMSPPPPSAAAATVATATGRTAPSAKNGHGPEPDAKSPPAPATAKKSSWSGEALPATSPAKSGTPGADKPVAAKGRTEIGQPEEDEESSGGMGSLWEQALKGTGAKPVPKPAPAKPAPAKTTPAKPAPAVPTAGTGPLSLGKPGEKPALGGPLTKSDPNPADKKPAPPGMAPVPKGDLMSPPEAKPSKPLPGKSPLGGQPSPGTSGDAPKPAAKALFEPDKTPEKAAGKTPVLPGRALTGKAPTAGPLGKLPAGKTPGKAPLPTPKLGSQKGPDVDDLVKVRNEKEFKDDDVSPWIMPTIFAVVGLVTLAVAYFLLIQVYPAANVFRRPAVSAPPAVAAAIVPVVLGVEQSTLYREADLRNVLGPLEAGAPLKMLEVRRSSVRVSTADERQGWVLRSHVCLPEEYARRQASQSIPKLTVCIEERGGKQVFYGGSLTIVDNQYVIQPGQAIWIDPTLLGKEVKLGGKTFTGDPDVLFYMNDSREMVKLHLKLPRVGAGG